MTVLILYGILLNVCNSKTTSMADIVRHTPARSSVYNSTCRNKGIPNYFALGVLTSSGLRVDRLAVHRTRLQMVFIKYTTQMCMLDMTTLLHCSMSQQLN